MLDTLSTLSNHPGTWDSTTPGGYAVLLIAILVAGLAHISWGGE